MIFMNQCTSFLTSSIVSARWKVLIYMSTKCINNPIYKIYKPIILSENFVHEMSILICVYYKFCVQNVLTFFCPLYFLCTKCPHFFLSTLFFVHEMSSLFLSALFFVHKMSSLFCSLYFYLEVLISFHSSRLGNAHKAKAEIDQRSIFSEY